MKVMFKNKMRVPAKIWIDDLANIESSALDQIELVASQPYVKRLSVMPDVHTGKGCTIGAVIGTDNALVPNFVGVDIGCGVLFVETDMKAEDVSKEEFHKLLHQMRRDIPLGFNIRKPDRTCRVLPWLKSNLAVALLEKKSPLDSDWFKYLKKYSTDRLVEKVEKRLANRYEYTGTLGGNNHFLEIQKNLAGNLCFMIHSGSRGPGEAIALAFMHIAKAENLKYHSNVSNEMEFFPSDTEAGKRYFEAVSWATDFAYLNRFTMSEDIIHALRSMFPDIEIKPSINIHHNYVSLETYGNDTMWVHRKGATRVDSKTIGLIPGSMGHKSYMVNGTDSQEAMYSCSHGAGRSMSRTAAKANLSLDDFKAQMDGIVSDDVNEKHLDESPNAYKNIETVMENQKDLVNIIDEFTPLANVKG
ncbi:RtcB family protein [Patescibacteria group bacterium]|nr:RtcB family protein [Patescibacteria group bacterium]